MHNSVTWFRESENCFAVTSSILTCHNYTSCACILGNVWKALWYDDKLPFPFFAPPYSVQCPFPACTLPWRKLWVNFPSTQYRCKIVVSQCSFVRFVSDNDLIREYLFPFDGRAYSENIVLPPRCWNRCLCCYLKQIKWVQPKYGSIVV